MMKTVFVGWHWYSSELVEGRILLVWRDGIVQVNIIQDMDQLVHCEVRIKGTIHHTFVSFVYGRNSLEERKELWSHLTCPQASVEPWLVVGDFNAIFDYDDRIGGRVVTKMEWGIFVCGELKFCCLNCILMVLFTLGLTNSKLIPEFTLSWIEFLSMSSGQIYFQLLKLTVQFKEFRIRPFRFYNFWINHEEFHRTVLESWSKPAGGYGLQQVLQKLKRLKPVLSLFNKQQVGDVVQHYTAAKQRYESAQYMLQQSPSSYSLQQEENEAAIDFANKSKIYESFLRQKSKINWLRFGDENTAYFHASLKQRRMRNRISSYINEEGHIVENYSEVIAHFYNHFKGILGKTSSATSRLDLNCFKQGNVLTLEQQLSLIQPFTQKDVKRDLFSIPSIKSPGPDGFGSGFFKALRKEIGVEISEAILLFFKNGEIPAELNRTILTLIPKVESPTVASDFRPIACCNILYKCISKMFCFHLAEILPRIIHQNQESSYTLLMNGRLQGSFEGRKGLRQGDPISPLLFVLGSTNNRSKFHCTSWAQVCLPKALGGLGFKEGSVWKKIILAKFIWALSTKQDVLWVKWIDGIYLKGQTFWSYHLKPDVSWYWRKICYLRETFPESVLVNAAVNGKLRLKVLLSIILQRNIVDFAKAVWCCLSVPKH
ncbi:uncharacterized protein LOC133795529 [Humulus lupulus]|uniref:uncharacterized protein LOC133795529 n=1 Tax=Humulus lupulus TaxID=3486 RepID=UPI002B403801|nr:uncharacterized protein LOC133795529 [Humulus lupulus]